MSAFPSTLSPNLLAKFSFRCGYCRTAILSSNYFSFESDHIISRAKGGANHSDNRALACAECNRRKSHHTTARDPATMNSVDIFNPNKDVWNEHFSISNLSGAIIGTTPKGRATADLLALGKRPSEPDFLYRGSELSCEDSQLLSQMALLRHLRLTCSFDNVINFGNSLLQEEKTYFRRNSLAVEKFIATQIIESYFTRSKDLADILNGIKFTQTCRSIFLKKYGSAIDDFTPIFDHFITIFWKQLISIGYPNSGSLKTLLYKKITTASQKQIFIDPFMKSVSNLSKRIMLGDSNSSEDLKTIESRIDFLSDLASIDRSKLIYTMIEILDLVAMFPDRFKYKANLIIDSSAIAYDTVKTHFSQDLTLLSLLQRRVLRASKWYDMSKLAMTKNTLLKYAKTHSLFHEVRALNAISI